MTLEGHIISVSHQDCTLYADSHVKCKNIEFCMYCFNFVME